MPKRLRTGPGGGPYGGVSLTGLTVIAIVAKGLSSSPSLALKVKLSAPL